MSKFFSDALTVIFTTVLALGWVWTEFLVNQGYIDSNQRLYVLIALTLLLAIQQIYLRLPHPEKRGMIEKRRQIIQDKLQSFLSEYYGVLKSKYKNKKAFPVVRVNVMLPTKRYRGIFGTYLKIYYVFCPPGIVYSDQELSLAWTKEEGTCGWAWSKKANSVYDSRNPALKLPAKRVKTQHTLSVRGIRSTLSIPIWLEDTIVGVLNLDSKQNVRDTDFTDGDICALAVGCAGILSGQCHLDGVEG